MPWDLIIPMDFGSPSWEMQRLVALDGKQWLPWGAILGCFSPFPCLTTPVHCSDFPRILSPTNHISFSFKCCVLWNALYKMVSSLLSQHTHIHTTHTASYLFLFFIFHLSPRHHILYHIYWCLSFILCLLVKIESPWFFLFCLLLHP